MNQLFSTLQDQGTGCGVLLVNAANAFNSLNCAAMLMHAHVLWPQCAHFLFNIYRGWLVLVLRGSSTYVTEFWKTDQSVTLGLFYFIGQTIGYTRTLHIHSVSIRLD